MWTSGSPLYHTGCPCPPHVWSKDYFDWRFSGSAGSSFFILYQGYLIFLLFIYFFNVLLVIDFILSTLNFTQGLKLLHHQNPPNTGRVNKMNVWPNPRLMSSLSTCTGLLNSVRIQLGLEIHLRYLKKIFTINSILKICRWKR